jgi:3-oxoacyl-[acyl-carrier-protein] synthase II
MGDGLEYGAVERIFGDDVKTMAMSSTKSAIGHLLGAAGSTEAIFSILAMNDGVLPPTLNLENPDVGMDTINLVALEAQQKTGIKAVLSNSFGFGGTNASIILSKV